MIIPVFGSRWETAGLAYVSWHSVARIALPRADAKSLLFFIMLLAFGLESGEENVIVLFPLLKFHRVLVPLLLVCCCLLAESETR